MKSSLSILTVVKNEEKNIKAMLESVKGLADEIILVDNLSTDRTVEIAKKYEAKIYYYAGRNEAKHKEFGLSKVTGDWVLMLDGDEVVTEKLREEIKKILKSKKPSDGYLIPYQSFFLGRPIRYGGENYKKLTLFKKDKIEVLPLSIHAYFRLKKGKHGILRNKILHYSYRSLSQLFTKFTDYAKREARIKLKNEEKPTLKKIFLYPLHMFWARFVKDKGYKDGIFRIPLDLAFAYMELMTYILLLMYWFKSKISAKGRSSFGGKNAK